MPQLTFDYREPPPKALRKPEDWRLDDTLPELHGFVGLDFETKDPGITNGTGSSWPFHDEGFVCGAAIAMLPDTLIYRSIGHSDGNMDPDRFWNWLRAQAQKPDVTFVMANAPYDIGWAMRYGVTFARTPYDIQGMATLLDENRRSYKLDALARDHLNESKDTAALIRAANAGGIKHPMSNMDKLPAWIVAPYATQDAALTIRLFDHYLPQIEEQGLQRVLELERECVMVAVDLRRVGVKVDLDYFERLKQQYESRRDEAIQQVQSLTGVAISPWDVESIARAILIENPRAKLERTSQGRVSITAGALENAQTPVATLVLEARQLDKLAGTFIDGYIFKFQRRGRIHAEFHPTRRTNDDDTNAGVAGARFSSSGPNLQNIPTRTEEGAAIRKGFIPDDPDHEWMKADYASQEPRLGIHFAHLAKLRGAADMVERFRADPRTDLHGETGEAMSIPRKTAKTINLGIWYGMQGAKLCHSLGLPTVMKHIERFGRDIEVAGPEGDALLRKHAQMMPFVKLLFELARDTAKQRGYVKTLFGRRCRFEKGGDGEYMWTYKALNKIIQNSAAEQMKAACVALRREGLMHFLRVIVHDEGDFSVPRGAEGEHIKARIIEIMERTVLLSVPVIADVKCGATWGDLD